jgi:hypothetical protein
MSSGMKVNDSSDHKYESEDEDLSPFPTGRGNTNGKWTDEEHLRFLVGLFLKGKKWNDIKVMISTRECA